MALKAVLADKAALDALPEAIRTFYKESNGRFVLDAEGMVLDEDHETLNGKLAEFRDNNIKLRKDLEKFKDVDPEKYRQLQTEIETLRGKGGKTDESEVQKAIEKALAPIQQQLEQAKAEAQAKAQQLEAKELGDALWQIGVKAGVREEAREFWLSEAMKTFKLADGELLGYKGDSQLFSQRKGKAGEPLTADEWALEIAPRTPSLAILYKDSKGGGAQPRSDAGGGARVVSRDNMDAISGNLEAIAKGSVVIQ